MQDGPLHSSIEAELERVARGPQSARNARVPVAGEAQWVWSDIADQHTTGILRRRLVQADLAVDGTSGTEAAVCLGLQKVYAIDETETEAVRQHLAEVRDRILRHPSPSWSAEYEAAALARGDAEDATARR